MIKILLARINSFFRGVFEKDTIIWLYSVTRLPEEVKYSNEDVLFEGVDYYYLKGNVYLKAPKIWVKYAPKLALLKGGYVPVEIKNGEVVKIKL